MKRIFIILITVTEIVGVHARDFFLDNMTTANTADMIRYGDVSTSLYTGSLDFSIPIFSLEDPDFNLNVALNYTSAGFKPFKNSGYVGQDWSLQAGGCITREVRNYPDEIYWDDENAHHFEGMYHFLKYNSVDKYDVFAQNSNAVTNCNGTGYGAYHSFGSANIGDDCTKSVDYMPDIYHFNFCGYSGIFVINNDGKAIVLSGDYVSVDLSQTIDIYADRVANWQDEPLPVDTSRIVIKTLDGYTYIFGGDISAIEYSFALKNRQEWLRQRRPAVNTWYLKEIIAPNRRTVIFNYAYKDEYDYVDKYIYAFSLYNDIFALPPDTGNLQMPAPTINDYHIKYS